MIFGYLDDRRRLIQRVAETGLTQDRGVARRSSTARDATLFPPSARSLVEQLVEGDFPFTKLIFVPAAYGEGLMNFVSVPQYYERFLF